MVGSLLIANGLEPLPLILSLLNERPGLSLKGFDILLQPLDFLRMTILKVYDLPVLGCQFISQQGEVATMSGGQGE